MTKSPLFNFRDLIAYFFVAGSGVLVQLLVCSIGQLWFALSYKAALIAGYLAASVLGFFLTRIFAFNVRNRERTRREMVKFGMVTLLSFLITVYGSVALFDFSVLLFGEHSIMIPFSVKAVEVNKLVCQLICMGVSFVSNYTLHKQFTFRDTGFYERLKHLLFGHRS